MPLNFSASHSSRITKTSQRKRPSWKRSSTSILNDMPRRKAIQRSQSEPGKQDLEEEEAFSGERLEDLGIVKSLATDLSLRDVAQTVQYVQLHMFDAIPENGGFNSVRIAELLNFRRALPPTVTVAHVHAFLSSPTRTEKEIAELVKAGVVRRLVIPGRGTGGSVIGEGLTLWKDVERLLKETSVLDRPIAQKFVEILHTKPMALTVPSDLFSPSEKIALMRTGFITSSTQSQNLAGELSRPTSGSSGTITSIAVISRAASGSMGAVGGEDAIHAAGGREGIRRTGSQQHERSEDDGQVLDGVEELQLSLPGMGPYLKLLNAARSHLVSMIAKARYKQVPLYLLRERWDGGISADDAAAQAKKYRGEFTGVLPSRTRKWKQYHGLSFDWVIAECLGSGLIELFETGSVGKAARIP